MSDSTELIDYPTLEQLLGSMDYCACEHCRSVLSPAAYLVDLLRFLESNADGSSADTPIQVLLRKRPDIEHLPLTCENTNTVMPYIDLVNEILEYYVSNKSSIDNFSGYDTEGFPSEELLANPQFVDKHAYSKLNDQIYPFNLPFNQPLETLRLLYDNFSKIKLHDAMEIFRVIPNEVEQMDSFVDINTGELRYGWREIYKEYLGISPSKEYQILTDSKINGVPAYFGENSVDFLEFEKLTFEVDKEQRPIFNTKVFSRKTGLRYGELIDLLKTKFINPNGHLITRIEKLGVTAFDIKKFKEGTMSEDDFDKLIPKKLDATLYGGDVKKWLKRSYDSIMSIIIPTRLCLSANVDTEKKGDINFDKLELRYLLPDCDNNRLKELDYWRLFRFIRLWRKLGWSIEETDKLISALYKIENQPNPILDDIHAQKQKLDTGFKDLLIRAALVKRVMEKLNLNKKGSLVKVLALWSNIDTYGDNSLYREMFLAPSILRIDNIFEDKNGTGDYLTDKQETLAGPNKARLTAIQAAFRITLDELYLIMEDAGLDESSILSLENISKIYRYCLLAKTLKISVWELTTLKQISGIDPFIGLEDIHPSILKLIETVELLKSSGLKISTTSYFLQNQDLTGKASPSFDTNISLVSDIKEGLTKIEQEHKVENDPTGAITKSKMALVYDNTAVDKFFGILKGTSDYTVEEYHHPNPNGELEQELIDISNKKISYDHFEKQLAYHGLLTEQVLNKFKDSPLSVVYPEFIKAVEKIHELGQKDFSNFFDKYPELYSLYNVYANSQILDESQKFAKILEDFMPLLKNKLKVLLVKQSLSSSLNVDVLLLNELLERHEIIHSVEENDHSRPLIGDFLNLETTGVSGEYFFGDSIGEEGEKEPVIPWGIDFGNADEKHMLPFDPANPAPISAVWKFYLKTPTPGKYNFYVETDEGAEVKLLIDDDEKEPGDSLADGVWNNKEEIELAAGRLHKVELQVTKVRNQAILKWESKGVARERIPVKFLYPYATIANFTDAYTRLLKAIGIIEKIGLNEKEILFFSKAQGFQIDEEGFLNAIPITIYKKGNADDDKVHDLFRIIVDLLYYSDLKRSLNIKDETLATILENPDIKTKDGTELLTFVTGWNRTSLDEILKHLGWKRQDLKDLHKLFRMCDAFEVVNKFSISVSSLLNSSTNQPEATTIYELKNALRAKYDESSWLTALQPISDELRRKQRDALVSYVLNEMRKNDATKSIDTPDKLFEYFLIDVQMDPCMKTSRIKQAISTVQLFIQRCLMNLEPEVSPSCINEFQLQWMKRYRVWEANRKIFLYPENWLEPELRLDKSSFFKDLEGELLQSDINNERAQTALLNYLEKLDNVSKLEIRAMYRQNDEQGDILHIFGKTTGASSKYYYRRLESGYYWTPWEQIDLDIEGEPILPVVWKGRLFLFWFNLLKKGSSNPLPKGESASALTTDQLNSAAKESIEVGLSWSEYYNSKWQPRKTSDPKNPIKLTNDRQPGEFDRDGILINGFFDSSGLVVHLQESYYQYFFKLFNKNSEPLKDTGIEGTNISELKKQKITPRFRTILQGGNASLGIHYKISEEYEGAFFHVVLKKESPTPFNTKSNDPLFPDALEAPFFYQNRKNVFYVKPEVSLETIHDYSLLGKNMPLITDEELVVSVKEQPIFSELWIKPETDWGVLDFTTPIVDNKMSVVSIRNDRIIYPKIVDFFDKRISVNKVISDQGDINFDGVKIGPLGSEYAQLSYSSKLGKDDHSDFEVVYTEAGQNG